MMRFTSGCLRRYASFSSRSRACDACVLCGVCFVGCVYVCVDTNYDLYALGKQPREARVARTGSGTTAAFDDESPSAAAAVDGGGACPSPSVAVLPPAAAAAVVAGSCFSSWPVLSPQPSISPLTLGSRAASRRACGAHRDRSVDRSVGWSRQSKANASRMAQLSVLPVWSRREKGT
jgi:hypothetical protein